MSSDDLKGLNPYAPVFIHSSWKKNWEKKLIVLSSNKPYTPWNWDHIKEYHDKPSQYEEVTKLNYPYSFLYELNKEEEQYKKDFLMFDLYDVKITKNHDDAFKILVHGISENRPPIHYGDVVRARSHEIDKNHVEYLGYVISIDKLNDSILVNFPPSLNTKGKFNIRFEFSSKFFKLLRNSLSSSIVNRYFPDYHDLPFYPPDKLKTIEFDKDLNQEQRQCCSDVLNNLHGYVPYIIWGPPGTGKTKTVIEIAKIMLYDSNFKSRILLCSPSNTASDILTERMISFCKEFNLNMFRLNPFTRTVSSVPIELLKYCHFENISFFGIPDMKKFEIIVTTTDCIPLLNENGMSKGFFSTIIIDENCQGFEPEVGMAINLGDLKTQVIIAGDHFQLGPIVRSNSLNLKISLQERMHKMDVYKRDSHCCQMLTKNYRSNSKIFSISSKLFYSSKIESGIKDEYIKWNKLKNQEYPIVFEGVKGTEIQEGDSPSWSNPLEAQLTRDYVKNLLSDTILKPSDIAVISPYRKQVQKIRNLLRNCNLSKIRVGTIEDYQGQEENVIIISTVRSNPYCLKFDKENSIGMINDSKRFNVAISRAKKLMIIIGNPHILKLNEEWSFLIRDVYNNGNYFGIEVPDEILKNENRISNDYGQNFEVLDDKQWILK